MTTSQEPRPLEFVPVYFKFKRNGRERLYFLPKCSVCGKVIVNIEESNIAVIEGKPCRLKRIGTHGDAQLFRESGRAFLFCWECDGKQEKNNVPWQNALATFRGLDEPQRHPEPVREGVLS
jgi:hypothetical protein